MFMYMLFMVPSGKQQLVWALVGGVQAPELVLELQFIHPQYCYQMNLSKTKIFLLCYVVTQSEFCNCFAACRVLSKPSSCCQSENEITQLGLTLCNLMEYTVRGILQARILEWVAVPFSRGSSQPRSPALQADSLPAEPQWKPSVIKTIYNSVKL